MINKGLKINKKSIKPIPIFDGVVYKSTLNVDTNYVSFSWSTKDRITWSTILEYVKALPSRVYNPETKMWDIPWTDDVKQWFIDSKITLPAEEHDTNDKDPKAIQAELINAMDLDPDSPLIPGLRPYQIDFIKFCMIRRGRVALGDEMGCGKTVESLAWMIYSRAYPAIFVVTAPTKLQWETAYKKWVSSVPNEVIPDVEVLSGKKPKTLSSDKCYIINWDILNHWEDEISKVGFKLIVGDEIQAIGNPSSQRSKSFMRLASNIRYVIGMSGTPAMSRPAQFWPLFNIMDPKTFPSYYSYLYTFCDPKVSKWGTTFNGVTNAKILHKHIVRCMLRRTKSEVLTQLPSKTMIPVPLEVSDKDLEMYLDEESKLFSSEQIKRDNIANLLRTAFTLKEKSLVKWVRDFLDSGRKLLLFAWHRDVVDLLVDLLKDYNPSKIYGGLSDNDRKKAISKFMDDDTCRIIVANIQSGGVGIDGFQTVCSDVAFAEFAHTPNLHRQAEDRLHRMGQNHPVSSYYLVAPDTIDDDALEVLDSRAIMLDGVLDGKESTEIDLLNEIINRRKCS